MRAPDYVVMLAYLLGIVAVGLVLAARNKNSVEMFAAGGQAPWWVSGVSAFMTMFSAGTFVVWGGVAYRQGAVAVACNICYGFAALIAGYLVAGRWNRLGVLTPAQFVELRYGRAALHFYTWCMMLFRTVSVGVALYSMCLLLVAAMPLPEGFPFRDAATGNLSLEWAIVLFGGVVVAYTMVGGLWGVLMTDVVQFIVLNLAVLFMIPLALYAAGGWGALFELAPAGFLSPVAPEEGYSWFFLTGWIVLHAFVIGAEWAFVQRFLCVPSASEACKSAYLFGVLYLVSPFIWLLPPALYRLSSPPPIGASPDEIRTLAESAYIDSCLSVLPAGMVGMMIAAMFSATASMISSQLNVFAGVVSNEIYRPLASQQATERQLVWAGRVFALLIGALFVGVALAIPHLGGAEKVIISATSLVVVPLLAPTLWGLFSPSIDSRAVWITAGICLLVGAAAKFGGLQALWPPDPAASQPVIEWVQANGKTVDLLIGVVLPVSVLIVIQVFSSGTSTGWLLVSTHKEQVWDSNPPLAAASRVPVLIVAWSLLGCALMMGGLAAWSTEGRWVLMAFSSVLCLLGVAFLAFLNMSKLAEHKG